MLEANIKPVEQTPANFVSLSGIFAFGCLAQMFSIYPLWSHTSNSAAILGHYSSRYALVLALNIALVIIWPILYFIRQPIQAWLTHRSTSIRSVTLLCIVVGMLFVWLLPFEEELAQYISLNGVLFSVIIIYTLPERPIRQGWLWLNVAAMVAIVIAMFLTTLLDQKYSPDEAHWADYGSTYFESGGVYARTWLQAPIPISPGLGWSVAAYGWTLEHIAFQLSIGRIWNFAFNLLAIAGVFAVSWRLYGYTAALVSAAVALLSQAFIPLYDYRPDHQLTAVAMLIAFSAMQARYSHRTSRRLLWNSFCGLSAALSLQFHAAGIIFIAAFGLFYLAEFMFICFRRRHLASLWHLLTFGIGAFIGLLIYFLFNIQPVGGLQSFLSFLLDSRWNSHRNFLFLGWPSFLEGVVIVASIAFVIWRRTRADYMYLSILACVIVGIIIFDTQGYFSPFRAFYIVPVGTLLVGGIFPSASRRHGLLSSILLGALAFAMIGRFIVWPMVAKIVTTRSVPPSRYEEVRPELQPFLHDNDIIVSSHTLIWIMPHQQNLISYAAELTAMKRWNLVNPVAVWERVQPTVIIWIQNEMERNPGLDLYMTREHFTICHTIQSNQLILDIYRSRCP